MHRAMHDAEGLLYPTAFKIILLDLAGVLFSRDSVPERNSYGSPVHHYTKEYEEPRDSLARCFYMELMFSHSWFSQLRL